jgi:hypothetical protein
VDDLGEAFDLPGTGEGLEAQTCLSQMLAGVASGVSQGPR